MTGFDWCIIVWLAVLTLYTLRVRILQMRLAGTVLALADFLQKIITEGNDG